MLLLWLGFAGVVTLAGQPDSTEQVREGLSAAQIFAAADAAQAADRTDDAVQLFAALEHDPDPEVRAEARFRKGMMLSGKQRYREAALAFRALLDEKPDAARVRLELARVLAALGDDAGARRAVRQAQSIGLPDAVAVTVDQFALALRSSRALGGAVQIAVAPDSNINRATQARTLDTVIAPLTLSRDARAQSGVGLRLAGQGYGRIAVSPGLTVLPRFSTLGNLYRRSQFNDVSASMLLGLEWQRKQDRLSPSIGKTWRWYGGHPYAQTDSLSFDWIHPIGRQNQMVAHGGAARASYRANDLQNGGLYDASIGFDRAVSPRTGYGLRLSGYRQTAADPGYAAASAGVGATSWFQMKRVDLTADVGLNRLEGDARLILFTDRRREWLLSTSLGVTLRQLTVRGFAPLVQVGAERNWSTVGLYDYRRTTVKLGVVRAF